MSQNSRLPAFLIAFSTEPGPQLYEEMASDAAKKREAEVMED